MTNKARLGVVVLALAACRTNNGTARSVGTVEATEVDIAPLVSARVTRMHVDEGAVVRAGDTLVSLTLSTTQPDIDAKRARLATATAQLKDLQQGARPAELERAAADVRAAEADASRAESDVKRLEPLARSGTVSAQAYDAAVSAAHAADAKRDAARQAQRLLQEGARPEQIRAARAEVENARAALAASEGTARDLVLTAPVAGVILERHAEPGEILRAGEPALTLGDIAHPWVRIFVDQQAMPTIRVGDPAMAVLDDYPNVRIPGRVVAVRDKAEFTPRVAFTEEERADLVFGVKIDLLDTTGLVKPGLPVTVRVMGSAPRAPGGNGDKPPSVAIPTKP